MCFLVVPISYHYLIHQVNQLGYKDCYFLFWDSLSKSKNKDGTHGDLYNKHKDGDT